jgi:chemotaxis protein methyltransferase CheR
MNAPAITPDDFEFVRSLLHRHAAIVLEPGKEYLVEARLLPLARRAGCASPHDYITQLRATSASYDVRQTVVEAMTIHETSFFRDWKPFETLKTAVFPKLIAARAASRELVIWSAACSTGQEPYSLAMMIKDSFPELLLGWRLKILASDVSNDVLGKAREGKFTQLEINRGLPAPLLIKHFEHRGVDWVVKDDLKKLIEWKQINLSAGWPALPSADLVLLRNVLIYFSNETRKDILGRVHRMLRPDGYLLMGTGESTMNLPNAFERLQLNGACCYRPTKRG